MATSTLGSGTLVLAGTTSGTTTVTATAVAGTTTLTLPAATDTLVGKATTDTLTNKTLTGAAMNGTLGATTPSTVAATTLTTSSTVTHNGGTANGVAYLDGSKVLTTGSSLTWDGTNLTVNTGTVSATYGKLTVAGGISITPDSSSKFQIGRYSAGAPYSYIKMGSTSSGLKFTDPADSVDLMTLSSTGALALYGASTSANGVGITFPATQSASTNANTLDDYEEGTWSSSVGFVSSGSNPSVTFNYVVATYTKIGRVVTCGLRFSIASVVSAGSGGYLQISGFPFAADTTAGNCYCGIIGWNSNGSWTTNQPNSWEMESNQTKAFLHYINSVGSTFDMVPGNIVAGAIFEGSITYVSST